MHGRIRRELVQVPGRPESTRRGGRGSEPPTLAALSCSVRLLALAPRVITQHDGRPRLHSRRSCKNELPRRFACLAARALLEPAQQFRVCPFARQSANRPPLDYHGALPRHHSSTQWKARSGRGMGGRYCSAARARGAAAPGATGLRTALKRTKSLAAARSCRCRRDACQCRWHSGSASSKGTTAGSRSARTASVRARGKWRGSHSGPRSESITTAHVRSNEEA